MQSSENFRTVHYKPQERCEHSGGNDWLSLGRSGRASQRKDPDLEATVSAGWTKEVGRGIPRLEQGVWALRIKRPASDGRVRHSRVSSWGEVANTGQTMVKAGAGEISGQRGGMF